MLTSSIDIVLPWVDDSDPLWIAEHNRYTASTNSDNSTARFREWDTLRYWFRSIETYAPWVRKIHFVTFGHLPSWLNINHPKIHIVNHKDFIPKEYLPTFSSHTIELNMHRIPDIAEKFVYFNDDVYLTGPTKSEDFFINNKPVDTAVLGIVKNNGTANFMPYIMLNMLGIINSKFSKEKVIHQNLKKWISLKNGGGIFMNLYLFPWKIFTGFRNYHTCNPFLKETFETIWEEYGSILNNTCLHKFRSREDVNQYLIRYWQLCEGNFVPHKPNSAYVTIGEISMSKIAELLSNKHYKVVCINDDPMGFDFEVQKKQLKEILEAKYPCFSTFELKN